MSGEVVVLILGVPLSCGLAAMFIDVGEGVKAWGKARHIRALTDAGIRPDEELTK